MSSFLKFSTQNSEMAVRHFLSDLDSGRIEPPKAQRRFNYDLSQMCNVITSVISGISLDTITLVPKDSAESGYWLCDGLHRLTTLKRFINNEFCFSMSGRTRLDARAVNTIEDFISVPDELYGKTFKDLPIDIQKTIENYPLRYVVVKPEDFTKDSMNEAIIAVLCAKNSCSMSIPKGNLMLKRAFLDYPELADSWDNFLDSTTEIFKGEVKETAFNMAFNSAIVSDAFLELMKLHFFKKMPIDIAVNLAVALLTDYYAEDPELFSSSRQIQKNIRMAISMAYFTTIGKICKVDFKTYREIFESLNYSSGSTSRSSHSLFKVLGDTRSLWK